jgi:hypothetical protein
MASGKGSAWEREFARELSLWWSNGAADDWFWRTGGSGGRATNRAKTGKATANGSGDICAQTSEAQLLLAHITFELKRGYSYTTIQDLLDKPVLNSDMHKFIEQASRSASLAGTRTWGLVVRRDRRSPLLITNSEFFDIPTVDSSSHGYFIGKVMLGENLPVFIRILPLKAVFSGNAEACKERIRREFCGQ